MPRPRTYRTEALVLRTLPFGEADLLVTLFTPTRGKLRAVAKGARRLTSKMMGHLEPLTRLELSLAQGRNLDTVTQAQVVEGYSGVKANLETTSRALFLAELAEGFAVEGSANPALYNLVLEALEALETPSFTLRVKDPLVLLHFQLHMLKLSGFMPELHHCVICRKELKPGQHRFSPGAGGVLCAACKPPSEAVVPLSLEALKVLRFLDRSSLQETLTLHLSPRLETEVQIISSAATKYWLEREVRSSAFMHRLERERIEASLIRASQKRHPEPVEG
jgi:DNA repair protein RecO (recombination protein O)